MMWIPSPFESNIRWIDAEIAELEKRIAELKRRRRVLAGKIKPEGGE